MKLKIVIVSLIIVAIVGGFFYIETIKKPSLITQEKISTSYCENDERNQDIYIKNTVTSGQLNKIDRVPNIESDLCESETGNVTTGGRLVERSCRGDILIVERYNCGYGSTCRDGRCIMN